MHTRPTLPLLASLAGAALLASCAVGPRTLVADVSSFGDWPAERRAGRYAFDRLPSQQAQAEETDRLEAAARPALEGAGFRPAAEGTEPDVLVQVGARVSRSDRDLWYDPIWWHGGFGSWYYGPWLGPGWSMHTRLEPPRYDREVALLLRDRSSGKPLFEARASSESYGSFDMQTLAALFQAALADFPHQGLNPRQVVVTVPAPP